MRSSLKKIIPEKCWPFLRRIDVYIINGLYWYLSIKYAPVRNYSRKVSFLRQSIPVYPAKIDFDLSLQSDVTSVLENSGISYRSGRHSAYICGEADICKINEDIVARYPFPFGLKIVKSREIAPDSTPYYTSRLLAPATTYSSMHAVGSMLEKVVISNLLNAEGVAPRVYDLVMLQSRNGAFHYAFVVQNIDGPVVYGEDGLRFILFFKNILKKLGMETVSISDHCDLRPPYFRDNIVESSSGVYYVDIQNFVLQKSSTIEITRKAVLEKFKNDPLISLICNRHIAINRSGKNHTETYVPVLASLLKDAHVDLDECIVVNLQQDIGLLSLSLLSIGALWAFLVTDKENCRLLRSFYQMNGFTRFDIADNIPALEKKIQDYNFSQRKIVFVCNSVTIDILKSFSCCETVYFLLLDGDGATQESVLNKFNVKLQKIKHKTIRLDRNSTLSLSILSK